MQVEENQERQTEIRSVYQRRWLFLAILVLGEYLLVSYLFDSQPLREVDGWWSNIGFVGRVAPMFFLAIAAAGLLRGKRVWERVRLVKLDEPGRGRFLYAVIGHLFAFLVFLGVSYVIFREGTIWQEHPQLWLIAWLCAGVVAAGCLWPAIFPRELSGELLRMVGGALVLGLVVGLIAWRAGLYTETLWTPLQSATLSLVAGMLKLIVGEIVYVPEEIQVGTPSFWVTVAPVCSGYEGIGLIVVFIAAYIICFRGQLRFPQVLLLFPIAITVAFLCNGVRITALILVGAWVSPEVAMGGFHSKAGWIFFSAIALGVVYLSSRSSLFSRVVPLRDEGVQFENPTAAYLMPLLALIATAMMCGMFLPGSFNYLYPVRIPIVLLVCWIYRGYFAEALAACRRRVGRHWIDWPSMGVGVGVFVMWILLEPKPDPLVLAESRADLDNLAPAGQWGWIGSRILGSVLLVPVVEELFFRGYLLRKLVRADFTAVSYKTFTWVSLIGSSVAFGFLHQRYLAGTLAGLAYAGILYRRGQLRDPIVAHAVTNGLIAIAVLGFGRWELWL